MTMPRMIITHNVVDVDKWLSFKEERAGAITTMMGGSNIVDYAAEDGSSTVAIAADIDDVAAVLAGLASPPPELTAAMEQHGVIQPMTIYVEK